MKIFKWICLILWWLLFGITSINLLQSDVNEWKSIRPIKELIFISQNAMETTKLAVTNSVDRKIIPRPHPFITSNSWKENNEVMHDYLYRNMYAIDTAYTWDVAIKFTTTNDVREDRNIFISINWKTVWHLDRGRELCVELGWPCWLDNHVFIYNARKLPIIWNNKFVFDIDITKHPTNINAFVTQDNNRIEEIYLYSLKDE